MGNLGVHNVLDYYYGNVVGTDFEELFWLIIILKASLNKCLILRCFFSISKLEFSTGYSISDHIFLVKKFELKF